MSLQQKLSELRLVDPVLSNIAHDYGSAEFVAPFVAPAVNVPARSGYVLTFDKSSFVIDDYRRAPLTQIKRIPLYYTKKPYVITQRAAAAEISIEAYEEALKPIDRLNLKTLAVRRTLKTLMQSWEYDVITLVSNPNNYGDNNKDLSPTKLGTPNNDPARQVQEWARAIQKSCGVFPNSAICSVDVLNALTNDPFHIERTKYTSSSNISADMVAAWFNLSRGIKVVQSLKYNEATGQLEDMLTNTFILFYAPTDNVPTGFTPASTADIATPSFAYTYTYAEPGNVYPKVLQDRVDEDRKSILNDVIIEQEVVLTALDVDEKASGGFLVKNWV
jgi:hypothetical protein